MDGTQPSLLLLELAQARQGTRVSAQAPPLSWRWHGTVLQERDAQALRDREGAQLSTALQPADGLWQGGIQVCSHWAEGSRQQAARQTHASRTLSLLSCNRLACSGVAEREQEHQRRRCACAAPDKLASGNRISELSNWQQVLRTDFPPATRWFPSTNDAPRRPHPHLWPLLLQLIDACIQADCQGGELAAAADTDSGMGWRPGLEGVAVDRRLSQAAQVGPIRQAVHHAICTAAGGQRTSINSHATRSASLASLSKPTELLQTRSGMTAQSHTHGKV